MKVLITGAEGFIGSHLVDKMLNQKSKLEHLFFIIHLIIGDG